VNDHVTDEIADFLEGRLSRERSEAIEAHLAGCGDCAADVAFARALRDQAMDQQLMHVRPARIVAVASGDAPWTEVERRHLEGCDPCRTELEWAERNVREVADRVASPDVRGGRETEREGRSGSWRRLFGRKLEWGLVAAVATVLVVMLTLSQRSVDPGRARDLARLEPIPVNMTRSVPEPGSSAERKLQGLERYRDGDYEEARALLREAAGAETEDPDLLLFLGSAALLSGDYGAAVNQLTACVEIAGSAALREEASWQLANAHLAAGHVDEARSLLHELAGGRGARAADAAALEGALSR